MGAPPPEAKPLVEKPKGPGEAPKIESKTDGTTISLSAGGQGSTGNSRLVAITANGAFESRFDANGIGFSVLGNYGRSEFESLQSRRRRCGTIPCSCECGLF